MNKLTKSLIEIVESEKYFQDARDWYSFKYLVIFSEKIFFIILTILLLLTFVTTSWVFNEFYPKILHEHLLIESDDTNRYYARIESLKDGDISDAAIYKSVAKYILEQYVVNRESYIRNNHTEKILEQQKLFVRNNSTSKVYRQFEKNISTKNPESPILKFRDHTIRNVFVDKIEFPDINDANYAKIYYHTIDKRSKKAVKTNYVASVNYIFSDINRVLAKEIPLEFKVNEYNVEKWTGKNG